MNILETILNTNDGRAVDDLGRSLGLDREQTLSAMQGLLPALAGAMAANAARPGGRESLEAALTRGGHERYLDHSDQIGQPDAVEDGNGILGHLFGSKDVSRQVANKAAAQTGIGPDILKKMLPMLASLAMAALAQRAVRAPGGDVELEPSSGGGLMDMLGSLLGGGGGRLGSGHQPAAGLGELLGGLFKR